MLTKQERVERLRVLLVFVFDWADDITAFLNVSASLSHTNTYYSQETRKKAVTLTNMTVSMSSTAFSLVTVIRI